MSTGLFGPRGPSYPYYPTHYPSPYLNPYPNSYTNPIHFVYPHGYHSPYTSLVYPGQLPRPIQAFDSSYHWSTPRVILPPKGLERILVAILILVVLDQIFIRPLKNTH